MTIDVLPRFASYSWMGMCDRMLVRQGSRSFHIRQVNHHVVYARGGAGRIRWIHGGSEECFRVSAGNVSFFPADGEDHTFLVIPEADMECCTLVVPATHLADVALAEGLDLRIALRPFLPFDDPEIRACMAKIFRSSDREIDVETAGRDEAARGLVIRLLRLMGAEAPSWTADRSVFSSHTISHLVDYIDAHLHTPPTLADIATVAGLSPSHFARKFRRSVGMSLDRFIIRRRIARSLDMLAEEPTPIADIALQLGFSSQSHLTRIFSATMGTTPAKYRREHRWLPRPR